MESFRQLDEEKQKRIITAALEEFANKGFKLASTNEIAAKGGISKGSLFNYFGSKKELHHFLVDYGIERAEDFIYQSMPAEEMDLIEFLTHITMKKLEMSTTDPHLNKFFLNLHEDQSSVRELYLEHLVQIQERLQQEMMKTINPALLREDLSLEEIINGTRWILTAAGDEYLAKGGSLAMEDLKSFGDELLEFLQKLFYKPIPQKTERAKSTGNSKG